MGSQQPEEEIKSMQLYSEVERIYADLAELGYGPADPLTVDDVTKFDHYHYYGTETIDEAIRKLSIGSQTSVLDIGSGLGGTSRYLANKTGCHVTALELQKDLNDVARDLSIRCGLNSRVRHICGNLLEDQHIGLFDNVVSWLVFLHIEDKKKLFTTCYNHLKPGGKMYIEDFMKHGDAELSENERHILNTSISCPILHKMDEYVSFLKQAGFTVEEWQDVTPSWTHFVKSRLDIFIENKDKYVKTHSLSSYTALHSFYRDVNMLFESGRLGGCKIVAVKQ